MAFTPFISLTRRAVAVGLAGALAAPAAAWAAHGRDKPARQKIVTVLGDSITAGFGLGAADALPAQLALALKAAGVSAQVRGAGVSGDTTADGLARVDFSVQPDTDLCLVALGANDLLQGVDPRVVQANLTAIVRQLKARRIGVLIAGMRAPANLGTAYARAFDATFPAVARAEHVGLYPFLLDGVALDGRLNQGDGIHPNAAGVKVIVGRLAPAVARALAARA
jgi:acyl-CoA thioesterase-1